MIDKAHWENQQRPSSPLGRRRHDDLTQFATKIARERKLGSSAEIQLFDDNVYLGTAGEAIKVSLSPSLLHDQSFALQDLRALLCHEIGHAHVAAHDPNHESPQKEREFAADAFAASVVGAKAMIRALRRVSEWHTAQGEPLTQGSTSHPTVEERIARPRSLRFG